MKTFKVIRKADGVQVYEYKADSAIEFVGFEFASFDHIEEQAASTPTQSVATKITKLAFRKRFTMTERRLIYTAKKQSIDMEITLDDQRDATFIDLMRADTRQDVANLAAAGFIAQSRVAEILDTPPTAEELYHGE